MNKKKAKRIKTYEERFIVSLTKKEFDKLYGKKARKEFTITNESMLKNNIMLYTDREILSCKNLANRKSTHRFYNSLTEASPFVNLYNKDSDYARKIIINTLENINLPASAEIMQGSLLSENDMRYMINNIMNIKPVTNDLSSVRDVRTRKRIALNTIESYFDKITLPSARTFIKSYIESKLKTLDNEQTYEDFIYSGVSQEKRNLILSLLMDLDIDIRNPINIYAHGFTEEDIYQLLKDVTDLRMPVSNKLFILEKVSANLHGILDDMMDTERVFRISAWISDQIASVNNESSIKEKTTITNDIRESDSSVK